MFYQPRYLYLKPALLGPAYAMPGTTVAAGDQYKFQVELCGVPKEQVKLSVQGRLATVTIESKKAPSSHSRASSCCASAFSLFWMCLAFIALLLFVPVGKATALATVALLFGHPLTWLFFPLRFPLVLFALPFLAPFGCCLFPLLLLVACLDNGDSNSSCHGKQKCSESREHTHSIMLPSDAIPDQLTATLKHGLLELTVPKKPQVFNIPIDSAPTSPAIERPSASQVNKVAAKLKDPSPLPQAPFKPDERSPQGDQVPQTPSLKPFTDRQQDAPPAVEDEPLVVCQKGGGWGALAIQDDNYDCNRKMATEPSSKDDTPTVPIAPPPSPVATGSTDLNTPPAPSEPTQGLQGTNATDDWEVVANL